jgi:hypothetical protein
MSDIDNIIILHTGGASNSDPDTSLGGVVSSVAVAAQTASGLSNITGVAFGDIIRGNVTGDGTLDFDGTNLAWDDGDGTLGAAVNVSSDGTYWLKDDDSIATVEVVVTAASLPVGAAGDTITIANVDNNLLDDIAGVEGFVGDTEYRVFALKNTAASAYLVSLWIANQPGGDSTLEIGLYTGGNNATAPTLTDENTAPAGGDVTFSAPSTQATGLQVTLAAGDYRCFYIKRTIAAGEYAEVTNDVFALGLSAIAA